ncbi:hypothetical protein HW932_03055 [Allochromatium humboldtianum]|uniref:Transposase n=1 Tax=Allochromatium humboldtianum TaxID=504901 RepID=A0A850RAG8_9GAMM|nr:hypothetical protein [Allochromatium humboldtianum]NVZ08237.1 hypothetical protein [Allochromatium humboldtianum]
MASLHMQATTDQVEQTLRNWLKGAEIGALNGVIPPKVTEQAMELSRLKSQVEILKNPPPGRAQCH